MSEFQKKIYIKGEHAAAFIENTEKIADELYHGNFSAMVRDVLIKHFNLDPETGERRHSKPKHPCK